MFQHQSLRLYPLASYLTRSSLPVVLAGLTVCLSVTASPGALYAQDDSLDGSMGPPPPRVTRVTKPGAERLIADALMRGRREGLEPVRLFFGTLAGIDRFTLDRAGVNRILKDTGVSPSEVAGNLLRSFRRISKNGVNVSFRTDGDTVSLREPNGRVAGRLGLSQSGSYQVYWSGRRVIVNKVSGVSGGEGASGRLYKISKLILTPKGNGDTKATATGHMFFFSKDVTFDLSRPKPVPDPAVDSPENPPEPVEASNSLESPDNPPEPVEAANGEGLDGSSEGPGIVEALESSVSSD